VVRTPLEAAALIPAVKPAVYQSDTEQPIYEVQTMQQIVSDSMSAERFPMVLLAAFGGLALLLASVGIYGTISYSVAQRVREVGIRMALGADKGNVLLMFVGQELRLALTGIVVGIVAALSLTRTLSSFSHLLYQVGTADSLTFSSVSFGLTILAALAGYVPSRRAAKVDPVVALRCE
jgi:putative ABC transport system permease protein